MHAGGQNENEHHMKEKHQMQKGIEEEHHTIHIEDHRMNIHTVMEEGMDKWWWRRSIDGRSFSGWRRSIMVGSSLERGGASMEYEYGNRGCGVRDWEHTKIFF